MSEIVTMFIEAVPDQCEVCGESDDHYHCQHCLALCGSTFECADGCGSEDCA